MGLDANGPWRRLFFRVVGNQSARLASYEVGTRAGQALHGFIAALNPYLRHFVVKDVLNVQACCGAPKDEWPYHAVLVLIAENEAAIRDILQASFVNGGFAVILASTGEEAIAAMGGHGGAVRVLITDVKLDSKVTGWDVARHGRELNPDLPVVYVTASERHDWASLGVPNSVLIEKPFAPAQVLTAVSQLLNVGNTPGA